MKNTELLKKNNYLFNLLMESIKFLILETMYHNTCNLLKMLYNKLFQTIDPNIDSIAIDARLCGLKNYMAEIQVDSNTKDEDIEVEPKKIKSIEFKLTNKCKRQKFYYGKDIFVADQEFYTMKEQYHNSLIYIFEYFLMHFPTYYKNFLETKIELITKNEFITNNAEKFYLGIMVSNF